MYTVEHLLERHQKQMERLDRQQARSAARSRKLTDRYEASFSRLKGKLDQEHGVPTAKSAPRHTGGIMTVLRSFLF